MKPSSGHHDAALADFHVATQRWFASAFDAPTAAQKQAWPPIYSGASTLLLAPTGSGKTLAAFMASLDRLMFQQSDERPSHANGVRVLYVSPLKALGVDVDRNLKAPIAGISATAQRMDVDFHRPTVGVRSGDTPQRERREMTRRPPDILITTPESLYLLLTSNSETILSFVETVIIDEIHVMVPTKRGVHLFMTLERLERLRRLSDPDVKSLQRIGLSATQRPLEEVARLLGGAEATSNQDAPVSPRPVEIVDASEPKKLSLRVEMPVDEIANSGSNEDKRSAKSGNVAMTGGQAGPSIPSIWPSIHPRLLELIRQHRSTMIFVNSRRLAERLASAINELAVEKDPESGEIALAHHGSIAKEKRAAIEDRLKRGQLPAIVATSSLELGIDMGAVDLVIQIEAPPTIASGMQRIGRSGHSVGEISKGVIFPKYRGDLLAASAAAGRMLAGQVEELFYPRNPLDLLAQQIVAMTSRGPIAADELYATMRGAAPYADLPRQAFDGVLDMLTGRYPSDEFAELKPRINWDRIEDIVSPRRGTQRLAILNGGTIPDRGLYGVFLVGDGPNGTGGSRVGELDEEMVFETYPGDVFLLGASSWRVLDITRDRVLVAPAPGEPGRMPFWRGDAPGRPLEFGREIGKLSRELACAPDKEAVRQLQIRRALEPQASRHLVRYLRQQLAATQQIPSDQTIVLEAFIDEIGDWRVCLLSPFGARVHGPWAIAVAARLREEGHGEIDMNWGDDGIVFRLLESDAPPPTECFFPQSEEVEGMLTRQLGSTALFAARFRENAARALLLPRRRPQGRTPLWMQRRKSADLLQVASHYPHFPILLETYRECLRDVFDLPGLVGLLRNIERRVIRIVATETKAPSPFAASLLFNYTGNFLYEGDAPLAERRAAVLTLDHAQLRELLGSDDLCGLLDFEVIADVTMSLARLDRPSIRDADDVHDLLLSLGDMTASEIASRCDPEYVTNGNLQNWIESLLSDRRIIEVCVAGQDRLAAAEDAARLRDALGIVPPPGLPTAFLEEIADPLGDLTSRFARTHGPFTSDEAAERFGLGEALINEALQRLVSAGRIVQGKFVAAQSRQQWCDATVLRQIKRRSLAKLREEIEAAPPEALASFLPVWQGVTQPRRGLDGLLDVIEQLQGASLPASVLETDVLPARLADYQPQSLDELFAAGEIVWRGIEGLGATDGRIALYLTDQLPRLAPIPEPFDRNDHLAARVRDLLQQKGALRFDQICAGIKAFPKDLLDALWRLVWSGIVTNDSLAPVRSLVKQGAASTLHRSSRRSSRIAQFRSRRQARLPGSGGRWLLLPDLQTEGATVTERQAAQATMLLERYGVLTRSMVGREITPGGFSGVYVVLKAMEEAGKVRRGYFVEGLGGAQFARPGADDLLRSRTTDEPTAILLAATDPANAYGAALPWPRETDAVAAEDRARPQRAAGAVVILLEGKLIGYLGKSGLGLRTWLTNEEPRHSEEVRELAKALQQRAQLRGGMTIKSIHGNGAEPTMHEALTAAGFVETSKGYVHRGD